MNREVMSRQMFRNGGVVYMAEGGRPEVVETFSAIFSTGDADKILDYFISHERELKRAAASNEKLGIMIDFIENMEARRADETIAETQRLSEMPQTGMIEVPAPGGSSYIRDPREELPFKGEEPQPPINLETFFQEYRQTPTTPPQPQQPQQPGMMAPPQQPGMMGEVPMQYFQEGGMAMPAPMPAAPGPEGIASLPNKAAMEAMPVEGVAQEATQVGLDPAVVQQMLGEVDSTLGDLENAESYEDVINGIREADAPIEARYKELAGFVGEEDAMRTPESVLTMLQPVIMMAGVDQGIGALASEEMTAPVTGDMAGGIMSTVNMGQEGVPPVNFNLGGAVQYFDPANENRVAGAMPGGRLGEIFGEKRDVYSTIMGGGTQEEEYQKQKDITQAQMLLDAASGLFKFAGGSGMPGRSPAEQLAAAASPVLGNISARAGELAKFKQAQAKEARAMGLAALTAAEGALTAEKAAEAKEVGTPVKVQIFSENENGDRTVAQSYTDVVTRGDLEKLRKLYGQGNVIVSAAPKAKSPSDPKPGKIVGPNGEVVFDFDINDPPQYAAATRFLNNPENKGKGYRLYTVGTEPPDTGIKPATGVRADQLRVFSDVDSLKLYAKNELKPNDIARINTAITDYLQPETETYFDETTKQRVTRVIRKTLPPEVIKYVQERKEAGYPVPEISASDVKQKTSVSEEKVPQAAASEGKVPEGLQIGQDRTLSPAVGANPVVADVLSKVGLNYNRPINLLEGVTDVQAAFGSGAAVKDTVNWVTGLVGGTVYPRTQEATTAMETLNDNFVKFFTSNADLRDSVYGQKEIKKTLPTPASFGTSLDKAINRTEATIRSANLALQRLAYSIAVLPQDSTQFLNASGKTQQLLGLRDSYRTIAHAYYDAQSGGTKGKGLGSNILEERRRRRAAAAKRSQGE